jgi:hypothetical protein
VRRGFHCAAATDWPISSIFAPGADKGLQNIQLLQSPFMVEILHINDREQWEKIN